MDIYCAVWEKKNENGLNDSSNVMARALTMQKQFMGAVHAAISNSPCLFIISFKTAENGGWLPENH